MGYHTYTVCHLLYLSYACMIGIISLIHKHCNIFTKMEIIFLHLDISWIILFGEKGMHALLSFKGCELLALRLKLLFLRSLYDWMADATSFSFFNLLGFLELWNLGTRLLLGVSLAASRVLELCPLLHFKKKIITYKKEMTHIYPFVEVVHISHASY